MKKQIIMVLISVFFIFHCSTPTIETDEMQVNKYGIVFFVFDNFSSQVGLISRSNVNNYNSPDYVPYNEVFIYDARVTLQYKGFEYTFDTITVKDIWSGISNNYIARNLPVFHGGDSVYLNILLPDQPDTVIAKTRIPKDISYLNITKDDDYFYLSWEKQAGCSYEAVLEVPSDWSDTEWMQLTDNYSGTDNMISFDKREVKSGDNRVSIYTFDKNFTDYSLHKKDPSGFEGQLGVFSGVNLDTWIINFKEKTVTKLEP